MNYEDLIREVPDFPKPGILFRDITPLLANPEAFTKVTDDLAALLKRENIEAIASIESRGFIFGAPLALKLKVPFIPVRKPGKLPHKTRSVEYSLEYGSGKLEVHEDGVKKGARVAIIDDLLATGGTAAAAAHLIEKSGGKVVAYGFLIELEALGGRKVLNNGPVLTLLKY